MIAASSVKSVKSVIRHYLPHARTLCKDFSDFVRGGCGEIVGLSLTALIALIGMVA